MAVHKFPKEEKEEEVIEQPKEWPYAILQEGYEENIRVKLGVKPTELTDETIHSKFVSLLAESNIIKRVPRYVEITDLTELLYLESAVVSYACYLLCPSMARRVNLEVTAVDVKWKKDKVDWEKLGLGFLAEVDEALENIESVPVDEDGIEISIAGLIQPEGTRIV